MTNSEGAQPQAGLVLSGNALFGAAPSGGSWDQGTLFRINTDGSGFTNLHNFTDVRQDYSNNAFTNYDGINPFSALVGSGSALYGTTKAGGRSGNGVIFRINTDGTGFTNLHSFGGVDGSNPNCLNLVGETLYGTASGVGIGSGTIFTLHTNGTGFAILHTFTGSGADGANPVGLISSGNTLYGATYYGGYWSAGCVFKINMDGTGFATLHSFSAGSGSAPYTNSDGYQPVGGLAISGTTLFGTTSLGGAAGNGVIFSLFVPPQLTITPGRTGVILSWPTNATDFTLEYSNSLTPPTWNTVTNVPTNAGERIAVTLDTDVLERFYRLRKP
jgi:uncharacterized repeat protein (TIGR03803 family)